MSAIGVQIEVDADELFELAAALNVIPEKLNQNLTAALQESGELVLGTARGNINNRTGELSASGSATFSSGSGNYRVVVEFVAKHAGWVEFGRGPVRPVRARTLAWSSGGGMVFAKSAGPAAPQRFLGRAVDSTRDTVYQLIVQAVMDSVSDL